MSRTRILKAMKEQNKHHRIQVGSDVDASKEDSETAAL